MSDFTKGVLIAVAGLSIVIACVIGILSTRADCQEKGGEFLRGLFSAYDCYEVKGVLK